jgi:hypothetical protein
MEALDPAAAPVHVSTRTSAISTVEGAGVFVVTRICAVLANAQKLFQTKATVGRVAKPVLPPNSAAEAIASTIYLIITTVGNVVRSAV